MTAPPSLRLHCADLYAEHQRLEAAVVIITPIGDHFGTSTFALSDPEDRWFAVISKP